MYNLFKFIEDKRPKYKVPFEVKLIHAPESLTKEDLNVKGNLNLTNTPIQSLPNGLKVKGALYLDEAKIESLPNGLVVGRSLILSNTPIQHLPKDLVVGRNLWLDNTPLAQELIEKGYTPEDQEKLKKMFPGVQGTIHLEEV